ncbi:TolC family protein [uncultured Desulfosarcina sp.]|uniref:TolC family protein n=1 Tax=uncultured Desulfosarcina sp. TaxID=218289 RepID=UPI0029C95C9E|nr:TolC family protein [uncultured Desulfosarcina sp.]
MQRLAIIIYMVLVSVNLCAAAPLTIDAAVQEALVKNPLIHQGQAYRQAADFAEREARANYLPRFSAAYNYQSLAEAPFVNINGNQAITNSRDQHHWEVALTQPLFSGFAISARHRLAELGLETRELELQQTRQAVILQVKQCCFDLLMAEKRLAVAESSAAALAAHAADVQKFHENGLVPFNDLLKSRVARADADQQQHRAQASVKQVRTALCLLIGRKYNSDIEIEDMDPSPPVTDDLDAQVDQALRARPEIAVIEQSLQLKENERLLAKSDYYPRIDLMGKYQQDGDDLGATSNDYSNQYNASLGVQARWTFFEFGKTRAASARVNAEQRALAQALEKIRDDIRLQVVQARLDLDVAAQNINTAQTALNQAREHWRITNLLYLQQLATSTEVLDARSYLNGAESAYLEARYGYETALAQLEWAMGKPKPEV